MMSTKTIEIWPKENSSLGKNYPVRAKDTHWGGEMLIDNYYEGNDQLVWLQKVIADKDVKSFTLVDVGANVGLFMRQALMNLRGIDHIYAYEPSAVNYEHLLFNLRPWRAMVTAKDLALGDSDGAFEFYQDPSNSGNNSFNISAMRDVTFERSIAKMCNATAESSLWPHTLPILYKSDTQGYDEVIATQLPDAVWNRTFAAIFEVWRIKKPAFDIVRFRNILEKFPHHLLVNAHRMVSVEEALEYLSGTDGEWDDLAIW